MNATMDEREEIEALLGRVRLADVSSALDLLPAFVRRYAR